MDHRHHRPGRALLAAGFVFALLGSLLGLAGPASAAPANDTFANRQNLPGSSASLTATTVGSTAEGGEPGGALHSIWYRWTATFNGTALISLGGSDYDTKLGVFTGSAVNSLTEVAYDDDDGPQNTSRVTFQAVQGTTYAIQVYGFTTGTGNVLLRLNPQDFNDVSRTHPFWSDIQWINEEDIASGYLDGGYHPSAAISRAAMSAFLYRLAGEPSVVVGAATFSDVSTSHPFFLEIEWMNNLGITTGYPDNTYRPSSPVSRGAMSAFIYRYDDDSPFDPPLEPTFDDVGLDHPFFTEIEWMNDAGITAGYPDNTFRPGAAVTRAAMAAFLHRYVDPPADM
jgi:hypothetical protein